jgi:hypothetical protein
MIKIYRAVLYLLNLQVISTICDEGRGVVTPCAFSSKIIDIQHVVVQRFLELRQNQF